MPRCENLVGAVDIRQMGTIVEKIFTRPEEYNGRFIPIAGENATMQSYVDSLSEKVGKKIQLNMIPAEQFAKFDFHGARQIAEMFTWFNDYGIFGPKRAWDEGRKIDPTLRSFKEYLSNVDYKL